MPVAFLKRRRLLKAAVALIGVVALVTWLLSGRVDQRLVGEWAHPLHSWNDGNSRGHGFGSVRLERDGTGEWIAGWTPQVTGLSQVEDALGTPTVHSGSPGKFQWWTSGKYLYLEPTWVLQFPGPKNQRPQGGLAQAAGEAKRRLGYALSVVTGAQPPVGYVRLEVFEIGETTLRIQSPLSPYGEIVTLTRAVHPFSGLWTSGTNSNLGTSDVPR